jgi:hypothetical protein
VAGRPGRGRRGRRRLAVTGVPGRLRLWHAAAGRERGGPEPPPPAPPLPPLTCHCQDWQATRSVNREQNRKVGEGNVHSAEDPINRAGH